MKQFVCAVVWGSAVETFGRTFATFAAPGTELHAFVFNPTLPENRHPAVDYHLAPLDPGFRSVRRDALFHRWTLPDLLWPGEGYALVVDATDAVCLQPLPPFERLLGGKAVAAAPEWGPPVRIDGQRYTGSYLNAGVTLWDLEASYAIRREIVARGRARYRGEFDDQTVLNEVVQTRHYDRLALLPCQYNWRALYKRNFRGWQHHFRAWPRVDSLDGVVVYHNQRCVAEVLQARDFGPRNWPHPFALLPDHGPDAPHLGAWMRLWRRVAHRWKHS